MLAAVSQYGLNWRPIVVLFVVDGRELASCYVPRAAFPLYIVTHVQRERERDSLIWAVLWMWLDK